jgi:hypothetical protein
MTRRPVLKMPFSPNLGRPRHWLFPSACRSPSPAEWSNTLSAEIKKARAAGDPAEGMTYYKQVIASLISASRARF